MPKQMNVQNKMKRTMEKMKVQIQNKSWWFKFSVINFEYPFDDLI